DGLITVYDFHSREEEAEGIAARIKSLVLDEGILPEKICVTTLGLDPYTELLRENLPSHGIPANITTRFQLDRNGLITALFSTLNILAGNYDRRDILRAVTSPYLDFGPNVDPASLADTGIKLRVSRGYN